jgi:hypothetical protein
VPGDGIEPPTHGFSSLFYKIRDRSPLLENREFFVILIFLRTKAKGCDFGSVEER